MTGEALGHPVGVVDPDPVALDPAAHHFRRDRRAAGDDDLAASERSRPLFATSSSSPIIIVGTSESRGAPSSSIVRVIRAGSKLIAGSCAEPVATRAERRHHAAAAVEVGHRVASGGRAGASVARWAKRRALLTIPPCGQLGPLREAGRPGGELDLRGVGGADRRAAALQLGPRRPRRRRRATPPRRRPVAAVADRHAAAARGRGRPLAAAVMSQRLVAAVLGQDEAGRRRPTWRARTRPRSAR